MSPQRHEDMDVVRKRLLAEYYFFCQHLCYISPEKSEGYFTLLENRFVDRPVMRGYYIDLINRYVAEEVGTPVALPEHVKTTVLPFISEVLMSIMYYDNQILDGKAGVTTREKVNHNLLRGSILLSELYHYIEIRVEDSLLAYQITKLVREVYEVVCIGQEIEIKYNHIGAWRANRFGIEGYKNLPFNEEVINISKKIILGEIDFPEEKRGFVDAYIKRIYLTNAYLFVRFTDFLTERSFMSEKSKDLSFFAGFLGVIVQIVNDITDLVPQNYNTGTSTKSNNDAFSDYRNKNITIPIFYHLLSSDISLDEYFGTNYKKEGYLIICKNMLKDKAIQKSQRVALKIKKHADSFISQKNILYHYLNDCLSMVHGNRFYLAFQKIKSEIPNNHIDRHPAISPGIEVGRRKVRATFKKFNQQKNQLSLDLR